MTTAVRFSEVHDLWESLSTTAATGFSKSYIFPFEFSLSTIVNMSAKVHFR